MSSSMQTQALVNSVSERSIHIFVLIDALGWEYIKNRPFLNDLLPHRQPLRTVLGFSSGAIPTILTGEWPSVTGHWNLFYYDPKGSPFRWLKYFDFLPDSVMNSRITSKILKEMGRHILGLGPLFDCGVSPRLLRWFDWVEKKNIYERGGISGAPSIFDQLDQSRTPYRAYTYHHWTDSEIITKACTDIRNRRAHFYFLYLSEMDMFLHQHCSDDQRVSDKVAWYDREIRLVYDVARSIDAGASLTILSDHGMTPVRNHYDLIKDVNQAGFRSPEDYLVVYDSTMARFWFFNNSARQQITAVLQSNVCGRIVADEELKSMGVFFTDRRFGEVIFLLHPGWMLAKSDFNGPRWMPVGMHGYHPHDRYSDGIFLSSQKPRCEVSGISDVYKCLREASA